MLTLERFAYLPGGTFGKLTLPSGTELYTAECPWKNNKGFESCIPEGEYTLALRDSPVIRRTSNNQFAAGWEVRDVPDRSFIMIHPGNWPRNVEGCIAVGLAFALLTDVRTRLPYGVTSSQIAFRKLMSGLDQPQYTLHISSVRATLQ